MASKIAVEPKAIGKNPFTVICYGCGREYGSKSITIHEKECLEKWDIKNKALPRNMRRPRPVRPTIQSEDGSEVNGTNSHDDLKISSVKSELEAYNDAAYESFQNQALFPCEICGRKFVPTALEHHKNACKPGGLFDKAKPKKMDEKSQTAPNPKIQGPSAPDLIPCKVCDRKFLVAALVHHSKVCKEGGYFQKHPPPTKSENMDRGKNGNGSQREDVLMNSKKATKRFSVCAKCQTKSTGPKVNFCSNCGTKLAQKAS